MLVGASLWLHQYHYVRDLAMVEPLELLVLPLVVQLHTYHITLTKQYAINYTFIAKFTKLRLSEPPSQWSYKTRNCEHASLPVSSALAIQKFNS